MPETAVSACWGSTPQPFEQSRCRGWLRIRFPNAVVPAPQEQETIRKKEELKEKHHQAYLRRKATCCDKVKCRAIVKL